jgi:xylan 1,4-beta-xylosidase
MLLRAAINSYAFPVAIEIDATQRQGELSPMWRFFGADEANYAYLKNGEKLLGELGELGSAQVYFRCHHLLTSGDGAYALKWGSTSAYREDAAGRPVYDWSIDDRIFDTYLRHGLKPYVQIGFMPEALTTHPQDYPHHPPPNERAPADAGQAYPPKDYEKWEGLCREWAQHCVEKYGRAEVEKWYWEVWNEPNIFYWHGTREEYFKVYDYAVAGVRDALPTARVGGPETAGGPGGTWLGDFLTHCARGTNYATGTIGAPLDFISFHAKGAPIVTNGHVRMGMASQLKNMSDAFAVIASHPECRGKPVIIGESDPEGCAACRDPQDAYRNGTMYSSYTAASFPRAAALAEEYGVNLEGALTWAFEFEDQPLFAGFRQLASGGLDLPVLNVFRMFGKMTGSKVAASGGASAEAEVSALASLDKKQLAVLVWHYHPDDVPGPDAAVDLKVKGIAAGQTTAQVTHYRIDGNHSNSYEAWKRLGAPAQLSPEQFTQLEAAGKLQECAPRQALSVTNGASNIRFDLPRQGVSLLVITWD